MQLRQLVCASKAQVSVARQAEEKALLKSLGQLASPPVARKADCCPVGREAATKESGAQIAFAGQLSRKLS